MSERRRHPRLPVRILVQHQHSPLDGYEVDYASDLSIGGVFVATGRAVAQDSTLHLQFAPAKDTRLVSAFCRVARVTPDGFAAQFLGLDADAQAIVEHSLQ